MADIQIGNRMVIRTLLMAIIIPITMGSRTPETVNSTLIITANSSSTTKRANGEVDAILMVGQVRAGQMEHQAKAVVPMETKGTTLIIGIVKSQDGQVRAGQTEHQTDIILMDTTLMASRVLQMDGTIQMLIVDTIPRVVADPQMEVSTQMVTTLTASVAWEAGQVKVATIKVDGEVDGEVDTIKGVTIKVDGEVDQIKAGGDREGKGEDKVGLGLGRDLRPKKDSLTTTTIGTRIIMAGEAAAVARALKIDGIRIRNLVPMASIITEEETNGIIITDGIMAVAIGGRIIKQVHLLQRRPLLLQELLTWDRLVRKVNQWLLILT